jgi:hypothetical protein
MTIQRFSKTEFEAALPKNKRTNEVLWSGQGMVHGEYAYALPVKEGVEINIRSSVHLDGRAADTGKDSIRAWIADTNGQPLGSKVISHTTRVAGWETRMTKVLRELWTRAASLNRCPTCSKYMGIYKVKKDGANKGRLFAKCWDHNHFQWIS